MSDIVDASLADAPVVDRNGYRYVIHPLMDGVPRVEADLLDAWADWAMAQLAAPDFAGATVLLAPEAMAIHLATAVSLRCRLPFVVARKRSYGLPGEHQFATKTGYGSSGMAINDLGPGDRVVVIDDMVSTGGTLSAVIGAVRETGATLLGTIAFAAKQTGSRDLDAEFGVPTRAMKRIEAPS